jgi:hypothetical protein
VKVRQGRDGPSVPALDGRGVPGRRRLERAARVVCHLVAEVPFIVVALVQIAQGWRPSGDEAIIAIRSWAVFTSRSPLLGEFTTVTGCARHLAFDPGPLLFWALAIPVRIDAGHGVLWGAALCCAAAMALCVEAAWAVRGAVASMAVGVFAVVLAATQPDVLVNSDWNPHFGLVWFSAACVVAWAVGTGRLRWWPVLVLAASISAQCHLTYTLPSALLAVLAPLAGILARRRVRQEAGAGREAGAGGGWSWLVVGLTVGAACWVTSIVQQLTANPGNVSVLLRCVGSHRELGTRFGLQTLASAVVPPPLWFHSQAVSAQGLMQGLTAHSAGLGLAVLAVLAVVAVVAWISRRNDIAVLAGVAFLAAGSTVWEIALQPTSTRMVLIYEDAVLWPVGMLVWGVVALSLVEVVARWRPLRLSSSTTRASWRTGRERGHWKRVRWRPGEALLSGAAAALLVGGAVNAAILASGAMSQATKEDGGPGVFGGFSVAATAAQKLVPRGPLVISVSGNNAATELDVIYGTVWVLISEGRQATAPGLFAEMISPPAYLVRGEPLVDVTVRADGSVSGVALAPGSSTARASARAPRRGIGDTSYPRLRSRH